MVTARTAQHRHGVGVERLAHVNRILVLGSSGSGKTYLSTRLGALLGMEVLYLDRLFWKSNWLSTPQDEWRRVVADLVERPSWIMDGTYESTLELRIPAADAVIYVDASRLACLVGVLRRRFAYGSGERTDAPARQPIDRSFLRYIWRFPRVTKPMVLETIRKLGAEDRVLVLSGRSGIDSCLMKIRLHLGTKDRGGEEKAMAGRLEHANITVGDVDSAVRFLTTAFPHFRVRGEGETDQGSWKQRWVHVGNDSTYVAINQSSKDAVRHAPSPQTLGVNHIGFEVESVAAMRERLTAAGYREGYVAAAHPYRKRLYFLDDDGAEWEFVEYLSDDPAQRNQYP